MTSLYLVGSTPITFVQDLLDHESPSTWPFVKLRGDLRTGLATTGIYTQLADEMAKEITLNTETALDKLEEGKFERNGNQMALS